MSWGPKLLLPKLARPCRFKGFKLISVDINRLTSYLKFTATSLHDFQQQASVYVIRTTLPVEETH